MKKEPTYAAQQFLRQAELLQWLGSTGAVLMRKKLLTYREWEKLRITVQKVKDEFSTPESKVIDGVYLDLTLHGIGSVAHGFNGLRPRTVQKVLGDLADPHTPDDRRDRLSKHKAQKLRVWVRELWHFIKEADPGVERDQKIELIIRYCQGVFLPWSILLGEFEDVIFDEMQHLRFPHDSEAREDWAYLLTAQLRKALDFRGINKP